MNQLTPSNRKTAMTAPEIKTEIRKYRSQIQYCKDPDFVKAKREKILLLRVQLSEVTNTSFQTKPRYKWEIK